MRDGVRGVAVEDQASLVDDERPVAARGEVEVVRGDDELLRELFDEQIRAYMTDKASAKDALAKASSQWADELKKQQ